MKIKTRKSFQPSNSSNSTRTREKFLTGVKHIDNEYQYMQLGISCKGEQMICDSVQTIKQEGYSRQQLIRCFKVLSDNKEFITSSDLAGFQKDKSEDFIKYEMIRILDREGKGYVSLQEFLDFYLEGKILGETQKKIPELMNKKAKWKNAIDQNYELFQKFSDKNYCNYAVNQLVKYKDSSSNLIPKTLR